MKKILATTMVIGSITAAGAMNIDNRAPGDPTGMAGRSFLEIGAEAFMNCPALRIIRLPNCDIQFGPECFAGCENLQEIMFYADREPAEIRANSSAGGRTPENNRYMSL
jgi:hypothetical protein